MTKKRIIVRVGDIFKITLADEEHCYGIKLRQGMAFFDYKSKIDIPTEEIIRKNILFFVGVDRGAVKEGGWEKIGSNKEFAASLFLPNGFIWDNIAKKFELYITETGEIIPSTYDEIKDLERVASWAYNHIEDRLRDYYLGQKCVWLEQVEEPKNNYKK